MSTYEELKENTYLIDKYFPINIFFNKPIGHDVLGMHWHQHFEMIFMIGGEAVFKIGNETLPAVQGDILFVNGGQLHSGYSVNNTFVQYYAIVFDKTLLGNQAPDPAHAKYISSFMEGRLLFPNKIHQEDEHYLQFRTGIEHIINEFSMKLPGHQLAIKSYLQLIITLIIRYYSPLDGAEKNKIHETNTERFQKLFHYIKEHYSTKITIEEAAEIVNLSPYHFCKTFKKVTGSTFVQFLNLYRVNEAEEMLRKTTLPITQIAEKVGFSNINYLDKILKQLKLYPPSGSRKQP